MLSCPSLYFPSIMKRFILVPLVLISSIVVAAQSTQRVPAPGDWPLYSRTLAGTRYSPLTEINTTNVAKMAPAWSVRLTQPAAGRRGGGPAPAGEAAPAGRGAGAAANPAAGQARGSNDPFDASGSNPQATPIVVGGVMYLPARGNQVLAIEAHTGKEVWRYLMPLGIDHDRARRGVLARRRSAWRRASCSPPARGLSRSTPRPACPRRFRPQRHRRDRRAVERRADHLQEHRDPRRHHGRGRARPRRATRARSTSGRASTCGTSTRCHCPGEVGHDTWLDQRMAGPLGRQRVGVVHDARRRARHPLHAGCRSRR